jgi:tetratricopeptide (TPR) repeat protein
MSPVRRVGKPRLLLHPRVVSADSPRVSADTGVSRQIPIFSGILRVPVCRHAGCEALGMRFLSASWLLLMGGVAQAAAPASPALTVSSVSSAPARRSTPKAEELQRLREAAAAAPRQRAPQFALTRALMVGGDLTGAHAVAESWREHDAYNLVVVRLLGDIETEQGESGRARRTYSSIVELLPRDVQARRALATVLKQSGDLQGARQQLLSALAISDDRHTAFELADVEYRLGLPEARERFRTIAEAPEVAESVRYPARQRLAQIAARERREAEARGDGERAAKLAREIEELGIHGGVENDLKVFLSWDTDRTDIDLWVTTPSGQKVFYGAKQGRNGEQLFDDVTTGYGPESFTATRAVPGTYTVTVDYFGARPGAFKEARGEVIVITNEGRPNEARRAFPYRLFEEKDQVTVAKIQVAEGGA